MAKILCHPEGLLLIFWCRKHRKIIQNVLHIVSTNIVIIQSWLKIANLLFNSQLKVDPVAKKLFLE